MFAIIIMFVPLNPLLTHWTLDIPHDFILEDLQLPFLLLCCPPDLTTVQDNWFNYDGVGLDFERQVHHRCGSDDDAWDEDDVDGYFDDDF